jgi:hypothetical protein
MVIEDSLCACTCTDAFTKAVENDVQRRRRRRRRAEKYIRTRGRVS